MKLGHLNHKEFEKVFKTGRSHRGDLVLLKTTQNTLEIPRFAVAVSKKNVKRAVDRNLIKRRIREAFRAHQNLLQPNVDYIALYNKKELLPYSEIEKDLKNLL